jgi:hypothetical protein
MSRRQRSGGTEGSNPVPSSGESSANPISLIPIFFFSFRAADVLCRAYRAISTFVGASH